MDINFIRSDKKAFITRFGQLAFLILRYSTMLHFHMLKGLTSCLYEPEGEMKLPCFRESEKRPGLLASTLTWLGP